MTPMAAKEYVALLAETVPTAIHTEAENENRPFRKIEELSEKGRRLSIAERKLMELLTVLVEAFEEEHYPVSQNVPPVEVLRELIKANGMKQKDLTDVFATPSIVSESSWQAKFDNRAHKEIVRAFPRFHRFVLLRFTAVEGVVFPAHETATESPSAPPNLQGTRLSLIWADCKLLKHSLGAKSCWFPTSIISFPPELIAQEPLADRSASRLLHVDRKSGELRDRSFTEFPELLRPDDLVVFNNTRVFPARLYGRRSGENAQPLSPHNPAAREFLRDAWKFYSLAKFPSSPMSGNAWSVPGGKLESENDCSLARRVNFRLT